MIELQPRPTVELDRRSNAGVELKRPRETGVLEDPATLDQNRFHGCCVERWRFAKVAGQRLKSLAYAARKDSRCRAASKSLERDPQTLGVEQHRDTQRSPVQDPRYVGGDQDRVTSRNCYLDAADVRSEDPVHRYQELQRVRAMDTTGFPLGAVDTPALDDPHAVFLPHPETVAERRPPSQRGV